MCVEERGMCVIMSTHGGYTHLSMYSAKYLVSKVVPSQFYETYSTCLQCVCWVSELN